MINLGSTRQIKSSYSTGYNNCVVVGSLRPDVVEIHDSKNPGPALRVSPEAFTAFARLVQNGAR